MEKAVVVEKTGKTGKHTAVKAKKAAPVRVNAGTSKVSAEDRHTLFIEAYLTNGGNATQAALAAGYSDGCARRMGTRLATNSHIRATLEARRSEIISKVEAKTEVTKEWITASLKTVAERCMQAAPVLNRKGERVFIEDADGNYAPAFTFEPAGANRALELLGKERGMFIDRKEIGEPGAFDRMDDDELTRAANEADAIIAAARATGKDSQVRNSSRDKAPSSKA